MISPIDCTVLVTPRSFGTGDPSLRENLEAAVHKVRYNDRGRPLRAAELREALADVDGLLAGLDEIDASVIAAAPRLRVIARYGVGTSNVDLHAAARAGVVVTNTPGANAEAVAELTVGFLFALARSISSEDRAVRAGQWQARQGSEVAGKTLGILGLGTIGRAVARRAASLGCAVMAYDPFPDLTFAALHQVRLASLEEVVAEAHFLTLHLRLTAQTHDLVDRRLLARMRAGSFLINTARGELDFLQQAWAQRAECGLRVEDGWHYFLHGWTTVIEGVFERPISAEELDKLAQDAAFARPPLPARRES